MKWKRGKLKGSAGSAGVKGKGWWLWLGALRCWLWKGSFSHWEFHHVPTTGASQPRRKGSLQRSLENRAEQADPCTGLDHGVIHNQGLLWETQPGDSSFTSAHGQPLAAPSPSHESQGTAFTLGIWLPKSGLTRETFLGAGLKGHRDAQVGRAVLDTVFKSTLILRHSLFISFSEERECSLEG